MGPFQLRLHQSDLDFSGPSRCRKNTTGINFYDITTRGKIKLRASWSVPGRAGGGSGVWHLSHVGRGEMNGDGIDLRHAGNHRCRKDMASAPAPNCATAEASATHEAPAAAGGATSEPHPAPTVPRGSHLRNSAFRTEAKVLRRAELRGSHTHTLLIDPKDKDK